MTRTGQKRRAPRRVLALIGAVLVLCVPAVLVATRPAPKPEAPTSSADALSMLQSAVAWAQDRHAVVSLVVIDRATGASVGVREDEPIFTASIAKLFIASQLALLDVIGARPASPEDNELLGRMLSASDDGAATLLWQSLGGPALIGEVAGRYGLAATTAPAVPDRWWETQTTVSDIAKFYTQLLDERDAARQPVLVSADAAPSWADRILAPLHAWTDLGADGYDQRFGLPAVVARDQLGAVKQGWMCCDAGQWNHLTTGFFGPGDRYLVVAQVAEDVQYSDGRTELPLTSDGIEGGDESAAHARATVTGVIRALFPDGVPEAE